MPDKPKGMHWKTYDRLMQDVADAEDVADELFIARAVRLLGRVSSTKAPGFWA